jgi:hypothetical protein
MTAGTATRPRAGVEADLGIRVRRLPRSPVFYGIVVALLAVAVGEWFDVAPPAAYGICSACHGRDLADWILNHTEGTKLFIARAGVAWPLLTVVGVVLGSFAASRRNREFASINLGGNLRQFVYGGIAMGAALFVGGCPTRLIIRTGYGDLGGLIALGGVAIGIVLATLTMRRVARR